MHPDLPKFQVFTALRLNFVALLIPRHGGFTPAIQKLAASDDGENGGGKLAVVLCQRVLHLSDERFVAR